MFSQLNYVSIKFAITVPAVPSFKVMYDSLHTAQQSYMYIILYSISVRILKQFYYQKIVKLDWFLYQQNHLSVKC